MVFVRVFPIRARLILGAWIVPACAYHPIRSYIKRGMYKPVYKLLETLNRRDSLLEEFDEEIFNALVEKIEILISTHFIFELKSGMRMEEIME